MKKTLIAAFASILLLCLVSLPAQPDDKAGDMAAGVWSANPRYISFGEYNAHPLVWRVLEVKDNDLNFGGIKTAFLLLDDLLLDSRGSVEMKSFDPANNSFSGSVIKKWLNDGENGFLSALNAFQGDMLNTADDPDYGPRKRSGKESSTSKVFLLSVREADDESYFANDADRVADENKYPWLLRSPGYESDIVSSVLNFGGIAKNYPYINIETGVRPALRINLSFSSVFANVPVSYGLVIKINDGNDPISGAKVFLVSVEKKSVEMFSNSIGIARFARVSAGEYVVTASKPGYTTKSENITVSAAASPTVSLTHDPTAMQDKVKFGKYNGNQIEWDVLDIVSGKALLFAGALFQMNFDTATGSSVWEDSSLRAYLNSSNTGDFLQEANFTAAEIAAIEASATVAGDLVFLLSSSEVYKYLPDAGMRRLGDDKTWLTRTGICDEDVETISPDGEYGGGIPANTRNILGWVRPAMWVDLSKF